MSNTIQSWHEYLCVPRTPRLVKARDLTSPSFQSPWLSLDEWLSMMRDLRAGSISLDLASMFLYMKLFPLWMSGRGDTISSFLLKTGVRSSAEELLSYFLTVGKGNNHLIVALGRDIPSITKSRVFGKIKPGQKFMILVPSAMSIAVNDLLQLLKQDVIDILGVSSSFGINSDLGVSLRDDCTIRVSHEERGRTIIEEARVPYVGRLVCARRR